MASIYKRGKTWTANVFVIQDGKRKRKTKSGFGTKSEANKWAIGIENQKINNQLTKKDGIIGDMFDEWYAVFKEPQLETKSKAWYTAISKVIRTYWPDKHLSEISSARSLDMLLMKIISARTLQEMLKLMLLKKARAAI